MDAFVSSDEVLDISIGVLQTILTGAPLPMPRIGSINEAFGREL